MGVIAGLFSLLQKLFQKSQELTYSLIGKSFALKAVGTTAIIGIIAGAYVAINLLITSIEYAFPSELVIAFSWVMPTNISTCLTAIFSAYGIKAAMDYKMLLIRQSADSDLIR